MGTNNKKSQHAFSPRSCRRRHGHHRHPGGDAIHRRLLGHRAPRLGLLSRHCYGVDNPLGDTTQWRMFSSNATDVFMISYYTDNACETADDTMGPMTYDSEVCVAGGFGGSKWTVVDARESTSVSIRVYTAAGCTGSNESRSASGGLKCLNEDGASFQFGSEGDGLVLFAIYESTGCDDADLFSEVTVPCDYCQSLGDEGSLEYACSSAGSLVSSLVLVLGMLVLLF